MVKKKKQGANNYANTKTLVITSLLFIYTTINANCTDLWEMHRTTDKWKEPQILMKKTGSFALKRVLPVSASERFNCSFMKIDWLLQSIYVHVI